MMRARLLLFPVLNTHIDSLSLCSCESHCPQYRWGFLQVDGPREVESPGGREPVFLV